MLVKLSLELTMILTNKLIYLILIMFRNVHDAAGKPRLNFDDASSESLPGFVGSTVQET
jgi:hypothetical protein